MTKEEYIEFIRGFSKITITKVCKKAKVIPQNLYKGRVSKENLEKVKRILEEELAKLYINEE